MDDIVDSFIIEDELPEPRRRRPATASGSGDDGGSKVVSAGLPDPDFLSCCSILIPCNLPVHAGLWLGQYANLLAREEGPLAIVRLSGNTCETEVFGDGITLPTLADTDSDSLFELMSWLVVHGQACADRSVTDRSRCRSARKRSAAATGDRYRFNRRGGDLSTSQGSVHGGSEPASAVADHWIGHGRCPAAIGQKASAKIVNCASRFLEAEITLDAIVHRMDVLGPRHSISINRDSAYGIARPDRRDPTAVPACPKRPRSRHPPTSKTRSCR